MGTACVSKVPQCFVYSKHNYPKFVKPYSEKASDAGTKTTIIKSVELEDRNGTKRKPSIVQSCDS